MWSGERLALKRKKAETQREDRELGPPGPETRRGSESEPAGARGLLLPLSPGRKRRRRLGLLPAARGEATAAATAGAPAAPAAPGIQGRLGADTGSCWACRRLPRDSPRKARCFDEWVWRSDSWVCGLPLGPSVLS